MENVIVALGFVALIFFAGAGAGVYETRKAAVERGHGLYCPSSGHFAWKGECDPTPA